MGLDWDFDIRVHFTIKKGPTRFHRVGSLWLRHHRCQCPSRFTHAVGDGRRVTGTRADREGDSRPSRPGDPLTSVCARKSGSDHEASPVPGAVRAVRPMTITRRSSPRIIRPPIVRRRHPRRHPCRRGRATADHLVPGTRRRLPSPENPAWIMTLRRCRALSQRISP